MKALVIDELGQTSSRLVQALAEEGYTTAVAGGRGEAAWLAAETEPDIVVICAARPGVHDLPMIAALRDDGEEAPILVLARVAETDDVVKALDAGADDVVVSPVLFSEVAARLRALVRRPPGLMAPQMRVGTLSLDGATHEAVRDVDGQETRVVLSRREMALLQVLMRHPGQVFSRTRLLEHVWGAEAEGGSNLVDQVVSHLRAKIDRPFGREDIQTVRGIGYRIRPQENLADAVQDATPSTRAPARLPEETRRCGAA